MNREIIAILRGVQPDEVVYIAGVLIKNGITKLEVPLNSPEAHKSIEHLVNTFGEMATIGAGTVLTPQEVARVADAGGRMIVSPDCNEAVIRAAKSMGLYSYPGVFTPTECFSALRFGADGLKLFPSFMMGPQGLAAIRAVLPVSAKLYAVGGVGPENFTTWRNSGATGFGIGTGLYRPGDTATDVAEKTKTVVMAYDAVFAP